MSDASSLPTPLREFVDSETWTFAKTYPKWPHEYIVKDRVDPQLFDELVRHIRQEGQLQAFYSKKYRYLGHAGMLYWTMVEQTHDGEWSYPVEDETIVNRCLEEESYENRLKAGTLPDDSPS